MSVTFCNVILINTADIPLIILSLFTSGMSFLFPGAGDRKSLPSPNCTNNLLYFVQTLSYAVLDVLLRVYQDNSM